MKSSESSTSSSRFGIIRSAKTSEVLFSFALFLIILFPLLGNSLAYQTDISRRSLQAIVLGIALILFLLSIPWLKFRILRPSLFRWQQALRGFALLSGLIILQILINLFHYRQLPGRTAFLELVLVLSWLFFLLMVITNKPSLMVSLHTRKTERGLIKANWPNPAMLFGLMAFCIGLIPALKGWWYGPEILQAHLSF